MIKDLGVLINCSQTGGIKTVSEVKRFVGYLKAMGYTYIMLYTEDTYEIEGEPFFGYLRGKYSKQELKEIVAYCDAIGIEVIPCIQTLGHMEKIMQWNAYAKIRNAEDTLSVDEEESYVLIEKMIQTCAECFKSRRINVGMDEAVSMFNGRYLESNGVKDKYDALLKHVKRVAEIAQKYGFTPYMWSDMWFKIARGNYYALTDDIPQRVYEEFKKTGMNLIYWDYFEDDVVYDSMIRQHKPFGGDLWFAGGACNWLGFATSNFHSMNKNRMGISSCKKAGIGNYLVTLWGGAYCSDYSVLPTLLYAAQCVRGNENIEDAKAKFYELFYENWEDFCLFDLLLPSDIAITDDITAGGIQFMFADLFLSKFDTTIREDFAESKVYAEYAEKFKIAAERSNGFKEIFERHEAYTRALSLKYNLGVKCRKAYRNRDMGELNKLVAEIDGAISAFEKFIEKFRIAFLKEMKGCGYNTYDLRFGGVLQRMKTCRNRLSEYLEGKIDKIEELDEELVDYYGGKSYEKRVPIESQYFKSLVTVNDL